MIKISVLNRYMKNIFPNGKRGRKMSKEYEGLARDIVQYVGGKENVNDVYHCQTRLRFKLADEGKADQEKLEALDGVSKVMIAGGVYQVIIGTHVKYVCEEVQKIVGPKKETKGTDEKKEKKSIPGVVVDFIAGSLQPIIPALSGAGMVKALLAVLVAFGRRSVLLSAYFDRIYRGEKTGLQPGSGGCCSRNYASSKLGRAGGGRCFRLFVWFFTSDNCDIYKYGYPDHTGGSCPVVCRKMA